MKKIRHVQYELFGKEIKKKNDFDLREKSL